MKKSSRTMGRAFVLALAVASLLAAMLVPASASSDSLTSSGASAFAFDGWARLPQFPVLASNDGCFDGELTGYSTAHPAKGPLVRDGDLLDSKFGHPTSYNGTTQCEDGPSGFDDADDNLHAHGFSYNEIADAPTGCLAGFASGDVFIEDNNHDEVDTINFNWTRVGATAVILLEIGQGSPDGNDPGDGVAVAAFEAEAKSGSLEQACLGLSGPIPVNAYVVGTGWYQDVTDRA